MNNPTVAPEVTQKTAGHFGIGTKHPGGDMTLLMVPAVPEQFDLDSLKARIDPHGYLVIDASAGKAKLHLVLPADETKMTEATIFSPPPGTELMCLLHARWQDGQFTFVLSRRFMGLCLPASDLRRLVEHLAKCLPETMVADIQRFCEARVQLGYAPFGKLFAEMTA